MAKWKYYISHLSCTGCGLDFPIPRKCRRKREKNHIKTMWCPVCRAKRDFLENRGEGDDGTGDV